MTPTRRVSSCFAVFSKTSFNSYRLRGYRSSSSSLTHGVHVFHCPDQVGIVAKLSECIASRGGNILGADIFVPEKQNAFYSRSEFVFDPFKWPREQMDEDFLNLSKVFRATRSVVWVPDLDPKFKIGIFASKQDHCLVDLLYRWQEGRLPVDITCVISNHERRLNTHVLRFLERNNIPYHYLQTTKENKREGEILELVLDTDFLVLARYMQILSGHFLRTYGKDVINIHHGLLPSFKGGNPSKQAFDAGVKLIGATSHFVTEELDSGPIIEQMILSGHFLRTYGKDVINIHHGLLPSFKGGNPSKQAFDAGVKLIGATSHFVTEELDSGPIIEQMVERVSHRENLLSFVQKSENLERQCLAKAIGSYCELRVLPYEENRTVVF